MVVRLENPKSVCSTEGKSLGVDGREDAVCWLELPRLTVSDFGTDVESVTAEYCDQNMLLVLLAVSCASTITSRRLSRPLLF